MRGIPPPGPWDPFGDLRREFGRLIETFPAPPGWRALPPYPPVNLYEFEGGYLLTAEVPGMEPEALDLSFAGETLTLRGERTRAEGVAEESYRRQERPFGKWSRSVTLPGRVDGDAVSAHYAHGILRVELPRAEEGRPRRIAVTTAP